MADRQAQAAVGGKRSLPGSTRQGLGKGSRPRTSGAAVWIAADACLSSVATLAGTLIAARVIGPSAVGLASIVLVILQIANFPAGALFADAIVQRRRVTTADLSAAFIVLLGVSVLLVVALWCSTGLWVRVYGEQDIELLLRVGSVGILFTGLSAVQASVLRRHMRFHILAVSSIVSRAIASVACILTALGGYGPWSLICQYVMSIAIDALVIMKASQIKLRLPASLRPAGPLLSFAVIETLSQFILANRPRMFLMLIGYYLPLSAVGEINLAFRIVDSLRGVISSATGRFCVAIFARNQARPDRLHLLFRQATIAISCGTLAAFAALAVCSPEIIDVIFGHKWAGAIPVLQWLSLVAILFFARSVVGYLLTATARPRISLSTGVATLAMMTIWVVAFPPQSTIQAIASWVFPLIVGTVADFLIARKVFGFSVGSQLAALVPGVVAMALMAIGLETVRLVGLSTGIASPKLLGLEVGAGAVLATPALYMMLRVGRRGIFS
jgi:O-antigen/teichoic acid export membrane protein